MYRRRIALSIAETNPLFIYCARLSPLYMLTRIYVRISPNEEALMTTIIFRVLSAYTGTRGYRIRAVDARNRLRGSIYLTGN